MKVNHNVREVKDGFQYTRKEGRKIVFREIYHTDSIMSARLQGEFDYHTRDMTLEEKQAQLLAEIKSLGIKKEELIKNK